jgi:hypothetical protein
MSVLVIGKFKGRYSPEFQQALADRADEFANLEASRPLAGCTTGSASATGYVVIVDEWESVEQFRRSCPTRTCRPSSARSAGPRTAQVIVAQAIQLGSGRVLTPALVDAVPSAAARTCSVA